MDAHPLLLAEAYAKTWRGETLSDGEASALVSTSPEDLFPAGEVMPDALLGAVAHHRPDILEAVDGLAAELEGFGFPLATLTAWQILEDYARRAGAVVADEMGLSGG